MYKYNQAHTVLAKLTLHNNWMVGDNNNKCGSFVKNIWGFQYWKLIYVHKYIFNFYSHTTSVWA